MARPNAVVIESDSIAKAGELLQAALKPIQITSASIKELTCKYSYEIMAGAGKGDKVKNREGANFIHDDLNNAFQQLNVHMAILDDAFKSVYGDKLPGLDELNNHEITTHFDVTTVKITGQDENYGIIIYGDKIVKHGAIMLESPKIKSTDGYIFFAELREAVELVMDEVYEYMNGKAAPKMEQGSLDFPDKKDDGDDEFNNPM